MCARLIEVRRRVNFVQLSDSHKGFLGRLAGTATASGKAFPGVDNVMMGVQSGPMRSMLTIRDTLLLDTAALAEVREMATSTCDVGGLSSRHC